MPDHDPQHERRRALRLLGRRIADRRAKKGWNQQEFAKRIGCGVNSISHWERGTHEMGILDALAIARELGAPLPVILQDLAPADFPPTTAAQADAIAEVVDLLDRSRRLLQRQGIDLLEEAREMLARTRQTT